MKNDKKYILQPYKVGECSIEGYESEEFVIIDQITREEIVYCEPDCYLVSNGLLKDLKKNNVKDLNAIKHDDLKIKFSIRHNMEHPNKKIPEWNRVIPFKRDIEKNSEAEIFFSESGDLIVNQRVMDILKKHRVIRSKYFEYNDTELEEVIETNNPLPVFKEETKNSMRSFMIFVGVMSFVAYMFFK